MKVATAILVSAAPYSQSRPYTTPKLDKESPDAYEERTWKDRLHLQGDGRVFIPPTCFKNCLSEAAKYLSMQIKGKGKATYTKHFEAGVMVTEPLVLGLTADEVICERLYVPADGQRGGSRRVWKNFPVIKEWKGAVTFYVIDETVTKDVFIEHLRGAGQFIGIGRFRPRNNGYYGRFNVESVEWK